MAEANGPSGGATTLAGGRQQQHTGAQHPAAVNPADIQQAGDQRCNQQLWQADGQRQRRELQRAKPLHLTKIGRRQRRTGQRQNQYTRQRQQTNTISNASALNNRATNSGELSQSRRSPCVSARISSAMPEQPLSMPNRSICLNRSVRSGSCGRPQPISSMAISMAGTTCQNTNIQLTSSVQNAASDAARFGPNVAVRAGGRAPPNSPCTTRSAINSGAVGIKGSRTPHTMKPADTASAKRRSEKVTANHGAIIIAATSAA
ncbi:hypothetical protein COLO4_02702 [Corchorus olitorius]|uniref:Uncharacterized protein n=1 Tax=Corchorus olitorius TaxID=93759 RepID=A0A1R3L0F7_9ROSI|nr:hypothetical protein COLO4_02702 [Corchorus olitorius]